MNWLEQDGASAAASLRAGKPADASRELFGINELAEEFGVTPRTLRFYENKKLIEPQRVNSARVYTRRDRARLALILRARAIGSSLAEISQYLDMYGERGEGRIDQLEFVIRRTGEAIAELEKRKRLIDQTLSELKLVNRESTRELEKRKAALPE